MQKRATVDENSKSVCCFYKVSNINHNKLRRLTKAPLTVVGLEFQ